MILGISYYNIYSWVYFRYTWIFPLYLKSQVSKTFMIFLKMLETQFETKVKCIQPDCGTKFKPLASFLDSARILYRFSCPYIHEQNGFTKRKHRQIAEVGLSLLFLAQMPQKYWYEAFLTSTFIINTLPIRALKIRPHMKCSFMRNLTIPVLKSLGALVIHILVHIIIINLIQCLFNVHLFTVQYPKVLNVWQRIEKILLQEM